MLTFRFTGANGEMIEEEMLAAGMVGKQVQFVFSEEWAGLRKVAVYKAGDVCCTSAGVKTVDTIPAEVLACSLQRLQVGIYGMSEDGSVVIPTIFVTGPFIHISAVLGDDPGFDPEDAFWIRLEEAIGELSQLTTEEKTSLVLAINENCRKIQDLEQDTVHLTVQNLTQKQQAQARQNIGAVSAEEISASGLSSTAASLLVTILKNGVYATDQVENIQRFGALVCDTVMYTVETVLENVTIESSEVLLAEGDRYTGILTPAEGYELDTISVTMGGQDVTAQVYEAGVVTIPAVTGNITIRATAKEMMTVTVEQIVKGTTSFVDGSGLQVNGQSEYRATMLPAGQYMRKGNAYRFSLGDAKSTYKYGVQIMLANGAGLTFPYVPEVVTFYDSVTNRIVDSGWQTEDYFYTADGDNRILLVNFKRVDEEVLGESDYAVLMEHFTVEEVAE